MHELGGQDVAIPEPLAELGPLRKRGDVGRGFAVDARAQFLGAAEWLGRFRFLDLAASVRCAIKLHMQTTHHSGARAVVHVG